MQRSKRYFNTSGPNIVAEHYTLMRPALVAKGKDMVARNRYFTIWAPRQTGKSTYFRLLAEELKQDGYEVVMINAEAFSNSPQSSFLQYFLRHIREGWNLDIKAKNLGQVLNGIEKTTDGKRVLIVDEIEGLNSDYFGEFLHTIRSLYHTRESHSLKSVILVGVSNIVGVVEDNASPFNIVDNLTIPYFTEKETFDLLHQHEVESGQLFEETVKAKISEITADQPGLVNGFADRLVREFEDEKYITYQHYLQVEDWYLTEVIDKNISNILKYAKKHRIFVERLLYTDAEIPFDIEREAVKVLHTNGLIRKDSTGNVEFWVPLYKKRLYTAFYPYTNGERKRISKELWSEEFFRENGTLNLDYLVDRYQEYVQRRSFKYFREKDETGNYFSIKEAALVYSFETYIQAFLQETEGKSYLEAHAGLGRSDLIIYVRNQEYVIEFKVYSSPSKFLKGQKQLAHYCKRLGLTEGLYLVFVANIDRLPKPIQESEKEIEGVLIKTRLIMYDEEKDF